jgi:hypothetical protein
VTSSIQNEIWSSDRGEYRDYDVGVWHHVVSSCMSILKMEAVGSSGTAVPAYQTALTASYPRTHLCWASYQMLQLTFAIVRAQLNYSLHCILMIACVVIVFSVSEKMNIQKRSHPVQRSHAPPLFTAALAVVALHNSARQLTVFLHQRMFCDIG